MSSSVGIGGSGDAGDSRVIVCVVDVSVGVRSSTTSCFNSQLAGGGDIVSHGISTTSDGAGGGDVVSHSRSC